MLATPAPPGHYLPPSSSRNSDLSLPQLLPVPFFHFGSTHGEVEVGRSGSRLYFSVAAAASIY